jgi:hypothetical protein
VDFDQPTVVRGFADPDGPLSPREWPANIPAVAQLLADGLVLAPGVTFLVGENGTDETDEACSGTRALDPAPQWQGIPVNLVGEGP